MDFRKLAFKTLVIALSLGGAAALSACGGDDDGPPNGDMCMSGDTHFFVASRIDIGQADPTGDPTIVPGFNLDDRVSDDTDEAGCFKPDFTAPAPDNFTGVDNQLGPILASLGGSVDVAGSIAEAIAEGSILLMMEVTNVDDFTNDGCVNVNLYLGMRNAVTPSMTCTDDAECDPNVCSSSRMVCEAPPTLDGSGRIAAGQTFEIDPRSLTGTGGPMITVQGEIVNGRVQAGPVDIALTIPIDATTVLTLNINMAQLRFNISATGLSTGIIGGSLDIEETISAIVMAVNDVPESLARSILEGQADLDPDAMGQCQSVSLGLTFDSVPAVRGL